MMHRNGFLTGQLLIAMPWVGEGNFTRRVVYICAHSKEGAMGIILNQPQKAALPDLLRQLGVIDNLEARHLPPHLQALKIRSGGPVEEGRGFVLHSNDYACKATVHIAEDICLTTTVDILKAYGQGQGPRQSLIALGYAGWGPGQLEAEINANDWLTGFATPSLLFDGDADSQYERCLTQLGVDPLRLTRQIGHA